MLKFWLVALWVLLWFFVVVVVDYPMAAPNAWFPGRVQLPSQLLFLEVGGT